MALKHINLGMSSQEILKRLQNERQILAYWQHANIARLLHGGMAYDGLHDETLKTKRGEDDKLTRRTRAFLHQLCKANGKSELASQFEELP